MHQFNFLLFNVLTPIFLQVGAGVLIQKRFPLDIASLGKVQFYVFIPALVFGSIYRTPLGSAQLLGILECNLVVFTALLACSWLAARLLIVLTAVASSRSSSPYRCCVRLQSWGCCLRA